MSKITLTVLQQHTSTSSVLLNYLFVQLTKAPYSPHLFSISGLDVVGIELDVVARNVRATEASDIVNHRHKFPNEKISCSNCISFTTCTSCIHI